jgi:hypothetical protein
MNRTLVEAPIFPLEDCSEFGNFVITQIHLAKQFERRFDKIGQLKTRIACGHIYPMTVDSSPCQRQRELLPSLGARRLSSSSFVRRLSSINFEYCNNPTA